MKLKSELLVPDFECTPRSGDIYFKNDGELYIVATISNAETRLVGLADGNRWNEKNVTARSLSNDGFTRVPAGTELTFTV